MSDRFPELDPLEIATDYVVGRRTAPAAVLPAVDPDDTPRRALRDAILPALLRPPCLVSFSGGRDSSAILAAATEVARQEGLQLPVPTTLRFPSAPRSHEDEWQEVVVRHLDLPEWSRVDMGDELDVLGPAARSVLLDLGPYWPRNLHFMVPIVRLAAGGSILTGVGGDETFQHYLTRRGLLAVLRASPSRRTVRDIGPLLAPAVVRRQLLRRLGRLRLPWLQSGARAELARRWAEQNADGVSTFQRALDGLLGSRYLELISSLPLVGRAHDVVMASPFLDLRFQAVLAKDLPPSGFPSRTEGMTELFGDLLPPVSLGRSTKAAFGEVMWGEATRAFAAGWDGGGVDHQLVDTAALSREWARPAPNFRSWALVQQAWLAHHAVEPPTQAPPARR